MTWAKGESGNPGRRAANRAAVAEGHVDYDAVSRPWVTWEACGWCRRAGKRWQFRDTPGSTLHPADALAWMRAGRLRLRYSDGGDGWSLMEARPA